jgi:uncharacterized membrane protein
VFESLFTFLFKYRPLMFDEGRVAFDVPVSIVALLVVGGLVAAAAAFTYARVGGKATRADRMVLAGLRIAALALILFCLFRPKLVLSTVVPQQNYVGVLVDDSRSMRIADDGTDARSAFVQRAFAAESDLVRSLADRFQLRWFGFSSTTERLQDPSTLTYAGARTLLAPALDRAREELAPVPLSGLIVVTDGADNASEALTESLLSLKAAGVPVYTVGVGREAFERDIELSRVATPRTALKGSSLVVDLVVAHSGYAGRTVTVLVEDGGQVVGSEEVELPRGAEPTPVRVHFAANTAGPRQFSFRIPAQDGELVVENNVQHALIDVTDAREKVLFFEGEPRYEVGFTRRAVKDDENLQLVVLQRTAENKYLRLAVDSAEELMGGFPTTREELFEYRGLVLGSVEASHFTVDQLRMIADFVSERGGGLLVLGGRHALAEGGYAGTPVEDALPVELDRGLAKDTLFAAPVKVELTRAGQAHFVTQVAGTPEASEERWRTLPELTALNRVNRLKPGATALLTGTGDNLPRDQVVLAYQRYGRGHAMVLPVWDTWMWQMHFDIPLEDMTHETFWRQMLRWLVSGVPGQVTVAMPSDRVAPAEPVSILAAVDDEGFVRVNDAAVVARVTSPSGAIHEVPLDWTVDADGEYSGGFTPTELGTHQVEVAATRGETTLGTASTVVEVAESTSEYFGSQMRRPLLERIAEETGGRFYTAETIASLPEDLSITGRGATVIEEKDLWDMPVVLFLLVGVIAGEWAWRRRKGLA